MLTTHRTARDGIVVGLIGYAAVALFYSAFDLLAARGSLYTVNLLGRAAFRGVRDPGVVLFPVEFDVTAVVLYNALHLVIALGIGLIVVSIVGYAERRTAHAPIALVVLVSGFVITVVVVGLLTAGIRTFLPWWSIVVANACATVLAGAYLLRRRPGLWRLFLPFAGGRAAT